MTSLDDATKQLLVEQWLPRLRELPDRRKPMLWLMTAILLIPIATAFGILISLLFSQQYMVLKAGICAPLLGVSALAVDFYRRIQSCNDVLLEIEFQILLGDRDKIVHSISNISCLGRIQSVLNEARPLLTSVARPSRKGI